MVVAMVMLIIGSDIARAFSLVGALSIIRFRNALKETRDVGFIFFTMAVGMAVGTRFYLLAVIGAAFISLVILLITRFDWYAREVSSQILRVQVPSSTPFEGLLDKIFVRYTRMSELISVDSVQSGMVSELTYSIGMKRSSQIQEFLDEIKKLNDGNKVTLIAGYNSTNL
jgi:uncharacterized membrane protein YhiD involved in acid resistance